MRRLGLLIGLTLGVCVSVLAVDGPLTNGANIRLRTNENGYLLAAAGAAGAINGPLTPFANLRVRTNENGYLLITCADCGGAGSGAATTNTFITQTSGADLSAEQALDALASGILRVDTADGVLTSLTDSAGIFANISDETGGTGVLVGSINPTFSTDINVTDQILAAGTKGHVLGSASADTTVQLWLTGTVAAATATVLKINADLTPSAGTDGNIIKIFPNITEAVSGTHALLSALNIGVPTITGGSATVTDTASVYLGGPATATVVGANYTMWVDAGLSRFDGNIALEGNILAISGTDPTIASGLCTSPTITAANGTYAFLITVGSTCAGVTTGTLTMPAATTGWSCDFQNVTNPASADPSQTGGVTTTVTFTNYARTTGLAADFTAADVIRTSCHAY